jgi:hypothetical protein
MPYLMFEIIDAPAGPEGADAEVEGDGEVFGLSADAKTRRRRKDPMWLRRGSYGAICMDGKSVVREDLFRARL